VLFKLRQIVGATVVLLLHAPIVDATAVAMHSVQAGTSPLRSQPVFDSAAALVVLTSIALLSYSKPRGLMPWAALTPGSRSTHRSG
jgi:hypothetical protein